MDTENPREIYYSADSNNADDEKSRAKALWLVVQGWRKTYATLFGQSFVDVLAQHHVDSIEWHWNSRLDLLEGRKPEYYADFPKWSRGHMKSTIARRIAVVDAFISFAYGVGGYCLYFSGTDDKTSKHAVSISQLLQSKAIQEYAPQLAKVKRAEEGNRSLGWKATFFYTDAGYVYHFGSLQSGLAGANVDDLRPSLMIPDDIDDRKDSVAVAESNTKAFTREILPMGKTGTLTFFAQNLISRFSVMYRIHKNKLKILTNRRPSEPVPAVIGFEVEYRTINGISKPFIIKGKPTWEKGMPIDACEEELHRIGEESFRSECQHEVDQSKTGLVHKKYEDAVHAISYSQLASVFGSPDVWKDWFKVPFSDWARTKTSKHANVAGYLAVSNQNSVYPGLTVCVPLSFPDATTPEDVGVRLLDTLTPYAYGNKTWKDLVDDAWKRMNEQEHFQTTKERLEYTKSYYKQMIPKYSQKVLQRFNVGVGANSHSEDTVRSLLNDGFGFSFIPSNPEKTDALDDIDNTMRIDFNLPHIFDDEKMGYSRFYVLCPDDLSQEPKVINNVEVYPPLPYPDALEGDELHDSNLFRYQMCNRRFADPKMTELGETIDVMLKLDDDFGQALQMVYLKKLLSNIPLSQEEKLEEYLPVQLRKSSLAKDFDDPHEKDMLLQSRRIQQAKIEREMKKPILPAGINRFRRR